MPAAGGGSWDGGGSGGTHTRHLEPRNELPPFPGHDSYALLFLFVKFVLRRKMISLSHMTCFETQCNSLQGLRKEIRGRRKLSNRPNNAVSLNNGDEIQTNSRHFKF